MSPHTCLQFATVSPEFSSRECAHRTEGAKDDDS